MEIMHNGVEWVVMDTPPIRGVPTTYQSEHNLAETKEVLALVRELHEHEDETARAERLRKAMDEEPGSLLNAIAIFAEAVRQLEERKSLT
jgi:hypothetical protein